MENKDEGMEFTVNRMKTVALPKATENYGVISMKIWKGFFGGVMNNKRVWMRKKSILENGCCKKKKKNG